MVMAITSCSINIAIEDACVHSLPYILGTVPQALMLPKRIACMAFCEVKGADMQNACSSSHAFKL